MKWMLIMMSLLMIGTAVPEPVKELSWIDDFESGDLATWHGRRDDFTDIYTVEGDEEEQFLVARSLNSDNFILKRIKVDIAKYPYLNWKWRAMTLPVNGDESAKKTCDVVASVNVVLRASKWKPKSIKYSWSTTLPQHTFSKSPYAFWPSRTDIYVLESGDDHLGQWKTEKVNVLNHYQRLYRKKKVKSVVIEAIVVMTDSDNTGTPSEAAYDDIYFSKS